MSEGTVQGRKKAVDPLRLSHGLIESSRDCTLQDPCDPCKIAFNYL